MGKNTHVFQFALGRRGDLQWCSIEFALVLNAFGYMQQMQSGLENSTRPLVFTSASGSRASENFNVSSEK